ncbi:Family of unknown function (DUF662, partial [Striga hermonthica]
MGGGILRSSPPKCGQLNEDEELSKFVLSTFRAKEEEIKKNKMKVKEKLQAQLGQIDEERKRLVTIRE